MATGDILSINIRDETLLNGVDCNGWVADITFEGMALGATADPNKVEFDVSGPGFDSTGAAITRPVRTIQASAALRKPIPAQWVTATVYASGARVTHLSKFYSTASGGTSGATAPTHSAGSSSDGGVTWTYLGAATDTVAIYQFQQALSGSNAVISYALNQRLFAGETITAVRIGAGAYGSSNAKATTSNVTNASTSAHLRPHIAWVNPPWQITGGVLHVELAATHPFGESKRIAACVKFIVRDAAAGVVTSTVAVMSQSTVLTAGNPVPVFAADINISSLTDGLCTVEAEVYPFRGNVTYKSADNGFGTLAITAANTLHYNPAKRLPFRKDAAGTFGRLFAYVDPIAGVNSTDGTSAVVSTDPSAARAKPFLSAAYALWRLQVQSGTSYSRANLANHIVRLMAGTHDGFGVAGTTAQFSLTRGDVWVTIERDPLAVRSAVIFNASVTVNNKRPPTRTKMVGLTMKGNATSEAVIDATLDGGTLWTTAPFLNELWCDDCDFSGHTGANAPVTRTGLQFYTNSIFTLSGNSMGNGNNRTATALLGGCTINTGITFRAVNGLGNIFNGSAKTAAHTTTFLDSPPNALDAPVWIANKFIGQTAHSSFPSGTTSTFASGIGWMLNLHEVLNAGASKGMEISADGATVPFGNAQYLCNTIAGEGLNFLYNDVGTIYALKQGIIRWSAMQDLNLKSDFHASGVAASSLRVGNMAPRYHVDFESNVVHAATVAIPAPNNLAGEVIGLRGVFSGTRAWADDRSFTGTNTGGGSYIPAAGSAVLNRIPAGMAPLPFDLAGISFRNDGTDAAGAFQVPDTTPPTITTRSINAAGNMVSFTTSEDVTGVSAADFSLSGGATLSNTTGSGTSWSMAISPIVHQGQTRTLSYSGTATKDLANNSLAVFSGAAVTNNSTQIADSTPPTLSTANVNAAGTVFVLTFSESILPPSGATGFTLISSLGPVTLLDPIISGSTYTATPSRTILASETLTVSYSPGNVTDLAANALGAFTGAAVTNNSTQVPPDVTAPAVTVATISSAGTTLTVNFSEVVAGGTGFLLAGHALSAASGSGATRSYTITPAVYQTETPTLSYTPGNIADTTGNRWRLSAPPR
jgi:hypothetical protein